jgi:uncharacterized membrane protein
VLGNGDAASLLFFGAFLLTALAGMPSIDAKVAARDPEGWRHFAAATSILPFGAIASGRNRLRRRRSAGRPWRWAWRYGRCCSGRIPGFSA